MCNTFKYPKQEENITAFNTVCGKTDNRKTTWTYTYPPF